MYLTFPLRMTFAESQYCHDFIMIPPSKSWCIRICDLVSDNFLPVSGRLLAAVLQVREYLSGWTLSCHLPAGKVVTGGLGVGPSCHTLASPRHFF